jgi:hypothetical protein
MLVVLHVTTPSFGAEFEDLLKRIPEQANGLLLIDVQALHAAPLSVRKNWTKNQKDYLADLSRLPPAANRLVVAASLNFSTLEHDWKIGLVELQHDIDITKVAEAEAGTLDKVSGQPVVLSPRNAYYLRMAPKIKGMMHPANRQELARWMRFAKQSSGVVLSPYLKQAAAEAGVAKPVLIALDLTDVLDPEGVRHRLKSCKALNDKLMNLEQITSVLCSLKGITVTIKPEGDINGEVRLDFAQPAASLGPLAKPLVLEALRAMGAAIEDLNQWSGEARGNALVLKGKLSEIGARQLLTPLLSPAVIAESQSASTAPTTLSANSKLDTKVAPQVDTNVDPKALASQRYFRSVVTLLRDVRLEKATTFQQVAYWVKQYAQKIDELPILNVDDELLKYGASVASTLRAMANLSQTTSIRNTALNNQKQNTLVDTGGAYNYGYRYGYRGSWGYQYYVPNLNYVNNYGAVNNMMAQGTASEVMIRTQTWDNIDRATTEMRRKMVQKYQVEF